MAKKVGIVLGVGLIFFTLITQPAWAAVAVQGTLDWLRDGAEAVITFVLDVFN